MFQDTLTTPLNGAIFRASSWPVDDLVETTASPLTYETKFTIAEEKVIVFHAFVTPATHFNEYALRISINDQETGPKGTGSPPSFEIEGSWKIADHYVDSGPNVNMFYDSSFEMYRFGSKGTGLSAYIRHILSLQSGKNFCR